MNGKKLLVADDSLTIQKVIRLALSNEGYEIQTVSDGNDAFQQIAVFRPDVILVDVSLPGKNAFELKHAINELGEPVHAKFILMSSAFEAVDEEEQSRVGFDGRLTKPFDPANLRSVLTGVLRGASPSAGSPPVPGTSPRPAPPYPAPLAAAPAGFPDLPGTPPSISLFTHDESASPEIIDTSDFPQMAPRSIPAPQTSAPPAPTRSPRPPVLPPQAAPASFTAPPASYPAPPAPSSGFPPSTPSSPPSSMPNQTGLSEFTSSFFDSHSDLTSTTSGLGTIPSPAQEPPARPSVDYSDIRHLTESTIRLSGLDDFQWSVSETGKKSSDITSPLLAETPEEPTPSFERHEYTHQGIAPPPQLRDDGGTSFQFGSRQAGNFGADAYHSAPAEEEPLSIEAPQPTFARQPDPNVMAVSMAEMQNVMQKQMEETLTRMAERILPEIAERILRQEIRKMLSEQP